MPFSFLANPPTLGNRGTDALVDVSSSRLFEAVPSLPYIGGPGAPHPHALPGAFLEAPAEVTARDHKN